MADGKARASSPRIENERRRFRTLITGNPNYFGNFPATGLKPVKKIAGNTSYEELESAGYNPSTKRLHATIDVKKTGGYSGNLCTDGSLEYVRFYVDLGGGWVDAGVAAANVHDIAAGKDCEGRNRHPLTYAVEVPFSPKRRWCFWPHLPRMRAILSWNVEPPAGQPHWTPVYGNVRECHIQIDKSPFVIDFLDDLVTKFDVPIELIESVKPVLPPVVEAGPVPGVPDLPDPSPIAPPAPLSTAQLAERYAVAATGKGKRRLAVEASRFAFAEVSAIEQASSLDLAAVSALTATLGQFDIDIDDLVLEIEDTTGNISYEELVDVGLDTNQEKLVATYHVKKPSGFSGGLCSAGSTEYVAFWADWDGDCDWEYLDTVSLQAYDFEELPDGGLCYSVALPVDLQEFERHCSDPNVARVRAVLSWNTPPSTTDPDDVPTWGNRLDAHVVVPPRIGVGGTLTIVGGVSTAYIHDLTGLASPSAKFSLTGMPVYSPLGLPVPFGGRVVIQGPPVPGKRYRLRVIDAGGVSSTLTTKVLVTPVIGFPFWHAPDAAGWFDYLGWVQNTQMVLGYLDSSGDDRVRIVLEIEGVGVTDTQVVQLDNTWPEVSISITDPVGDCGKVVPGVTMQGRVHATDTNMGGWSVVVDGGPSGFGPVAVPGASGNTNTPPAGVEWTFDTTGLEACGYVVRVHANDRAIVNSGNHQHHRSEDVGFCVDA